MQVKPENGCQITTLSIYFYAIRFFMTLMSFAKQQAFILVTISSSIYNPAKTESHAILSTQHP